MKNKLIILLVIAMCLGLIGCNKEEPGVGISNEPTENTAVTEVATPTPIAEQSEDENVDTEEPVQEEPIVEEQDIGQVVVEAPMTEDKTMEQLQEVDDIISEIYNDKIATKEAERVSSETADISVIEEELVDYLNEEGYRENIVKQLRIYKSGVQDYLTSTDAKEKLDAINNKILPALDTLINESIELDIKTTEIVKLNDLFIKEYHLRYVAYSILAVNTENEDIISKGNAYLNRADKVNEEYTEYYNEIIDEYRTS